jgi:hypothetical protein
MDRKALIKGPEAISVASYYNTALEAQYFTGGRTVAILIAIRGVGAVAVLISACRAGNHAIRESRRGGKGREEAEELRQNLENKRATCLQNYFSKVFSVLSSAFAAFPRIFPLPKKSPRTGSEAASFSNSVCRRLYQAEG